MRKVLSILEKSLCHKPILDVSCETVCQTNLAFDKSPSDRRRYCHGVERRTDSHCMNVFCRPPNILPERTTPGRGIASLTFPLLVPRYSWCWWRYGQCGSTHLPRTRRVEQVGSSREVLAFPLLEARVIKAANEEDLDWTRSLREMAGMIQMRCRKSLRSEAMECPFSP